MYETEQVFVNYKIIESWPSLYLKESTILNADFGQMTFARVYDCRLADDK